MLGLSNVETITLAVVGFFVLLALTAVVRAVLRREARWRSIRVGLFLERDNDPPSDERGRRID